MELPKHPFVPFMEVAQRFAEKNINNKVYQKLFIASTKIWAWFVGLSKKEKKIQDAFNQGKDGYFHDTWRFPQLFYPEISASFFLQASDDSDCILIAAKTIYSALSFRKSLIEGTFATEYESGKPLDMQRYHYLFSRITITDYKNKELTHTITDFKDNNHIILVVNKIYYKLQVIKESAIISLDKLYQQLQFIVSDAYENSNKNIENNFPLGLITTLCNKKSALLYRRLKALNLENITLLNSGIFLLALDLESSPITLESFARSIHVDNFYNRDYRRSMQFVVTGNARVGMIVNPHAGIGGTLSSKFLSEIWLMNKNLKLTNNTSIDNQKLFSNLEFKYLDLKNSNKDLSILYMQMKKWIYPEGFPSVFQINGIGKKVFAEHHINADGAFHCALHLAFYKYYGRSPIVGNFINLRNVQHGDIWRYISTTTEIKNYVEQPTYENLCKAIEMHKALVKLTKKGEDEIYQALMNLIYFIRNKEIHFLSVIGYQLIASLFIKNFSTRFILPDIWVSNIPVHPGMELTGRPGVQLSYLAKNTIAGHYMIFDNHIVTCIVCNAGSKHYLGQEQDFNKVLKEELSYIRNLCLVQKTQSTLLKYQENTSERSVVEEV